MTDFSKIENRIREEFPSVLLMRNVAMSDYCSFSIGGPAAMMIAPDSENAEAIMSLLKEQQVPVLIIGRGTNLLVDDKGLDMCVVRVSDAMGDIRADGEYVTACCGASLARIASFARDKGLTGFEFAHGIPGSLGGAVVMNAGAYGGEMKDVVVRTRYVRTNGEVGVVEGKEHDFSYRHSIFSDGGCLLLESTIKLTAGNPEEISARMKELAEKRRASQPLDMPSAGSTFKRPVGGYAAALIEQAGLKGYSIGGAQVSTKHAGFVVNKGGATFDDVISLMDHIKETVYKVSGIELEPEVKIIRG